MPTRGPPTELRPRRARTATAPPRTVVGWREWVGLPDLGIDAIKAKVDTGARTSVVHAEELRFVRRGAKRYVRFIIEPLQRSSDDAVQTIAELVGYRRIRSSNGVSERRPVIRTHLQVGPQRWPIELTLTSRDSMGFRMLIGRMALVRHAVVDPAASYRTRKPPARKKKSGGSGPKPKKRKPAT